MAQVSNAKSNKKESVEEEHETKASNYRAGISKKAKFPDLSTGSYFERNELCGIANEIFKNAFADFTGSSIVRVPNTNISYFRLFFDNGSHHDKDDAVAFELGSKKKCAQNDMLNAWRQRDFSMENGDRFILSDDAISAMQQYIVDNNCYNRDGSLKLNKIATIVSTRENYAYQRPTLYNAIDYVDMKQVLKEYFGDKDDQGNDIDYIAFQVTSQPDPRTVQNFMAYPELYMVNKLNAAAVTKLANQVGIPTYTDNLNMVRCDK